MTTLSSELYSELRAVVMIELMYSCGLRVSELVGIDINDLDLEEGFVRVKGKGGKTRFSPIGSSAIMQLKCILSRRPNCENNALFVNQKNHRISPRSVQNIVKKRALEVGLLSTFILICLGMLLRLIFYNQVMILELYKSFWVIRALKVPKYIRT